MCPKTLRTSIFDRCWALVNTDAPPVDPNERVLDLRHGTDLTLEACLSTIRSLLLEAGITHLVWDHPVSNPTRESSPAAQPLIDRLGQLYPDHPDIVDPQPPSSTIVRAVDEPRGLAEREGHRVRHSRRSADRTSAIPRSAGTLL